LAAEEIWGFALDQSELVVGRQGTTNAGLEIVIGQTLPLPIDQRDLRTQLDLLFV